jgi:hypothetical protein
LRARSWWLSGEEHLVRTRFNIKVKREKRINSPKMNKKDTLSDEKRGKIQGMRQEMI